MTNQVYQSFLIGQVVGKNYPVAIEYDCHGKRVQKAFTNAYEARRFYMLKLKAEKNPVVKKISSELD